MAKATKSSGPKKTRRAAKWLVFIDTNVLLDFYRLGGESAKRTLATLEKHKASLITTDQVWMEFLKNRQKVISQTLSQMTAPTNNSMPPFVNDMKAVKKHAKLQSELGKSHRKVVQTIEKVLLDPAKHDLVYQSLSKIFDRDDAINLKRPNKRRYAIRHLARKRFGLGYPPRKDDTLRFGDSINWEWIVECAANSKGRENIIIVSRDGDFGAKLGKQIVLNDWLRLEFKQRVSRQRKIELTDRLSTALKKIDVDVTEKDVAEEGRILSTAFMPWIKLANLDALKRLSELSVVKWNPDTLQSLQTLQTLQTLKLSDLVAKPPSSEDSSD